MRVGQALGLRHADFVSRAKEVHIVPRGDNANGARAKLRSPAVVPVSAGLVRLYSDYMHAEYGEHRLRLRVREPVGRRGGPADDLRRGARAGRPHRRPAPGSTSPLHMLRHTQATELIRSGRGHRGGGPAADPQLVDDDEPDLRAPRRGRHP